jgi:pimeloyl-ACP methyl ester carboxylesterase
LVELRTHTYGRAGPKVIVLHGGPAAVGEAEPIARTLSKSFRVFEPYQRGSGVVPLTVADHVSDLYRLVEIVGDDGKPSVVGESWGAMLALAYAAEHPESVAAIVLVGCGTFDEASRNRMDEILQSRIDEPTRTKLNSLVQDPADPGEKLSAAHELMRAAYSYDPIPSDGQLLLRQPLDVRAHAETWADMLRLQEQGIYPSAFSRIRIPILMLHGEYDPHPGRMIYDILRAHMPQLEYLELAKCGHSPWTERQARKHFFMVMSNWLLKNSE